MFPTTTELQQVEKYALELQSIPEEDLGEMNLSKLQAFANRLKVQTFDDKQKQIEAILWGREFYATPKRHYKEPTKEETARYWLVERAKETWSLKKLRLLALENEVAPIKGHPRHRETWINALADAGIFQ